MTNCLRGLRPLFWVYLVVGLLSIPPAFLGGALPKGAHGMIAGFLLAAALIIYKQRHEPDE